MRDSKLLVVAAVSGRERERESFSLVIRLIHSAHTVISSAQLLLLLLLRLSVVLVILEKSACLRLGWVLRRFTVNVDAWQ